MREGVVSPITCPDCRKPLEWERGMSAFCCPECGYERPPDYKRRCLDCGSDDLHVNAPRRPRRWLCQVCGAVEYDTLEDRADVAYAEYKESLT
jgi:predicted RNA-binding Zn-ribbon protein involved in translation (DUF1610 family)